ncbi:MAG: hypothetical protein ABIA04_07535 [Pseudomonadota bacterium]
MRSFSNSVKAACISGSAANESGWTCDVGEVPGIDDRCHPGYSAILYEPLWYYACMSTGEAAAGANDPCSGGSTAIVTETGNVCISGGDYVP